MGIKIEYIFYPKDRNYINYRPKIEYKTPSGRLHRLNGPAYEDSFREEWWHFGKRHRLDGPAYIDNMSLNKEWWRFGKRHRVGGPATSYNDGGYVEYWLNGVEYTKDEYYCIMNIQKNNKILGEFL